MEFRHVRHRVQARHPITPLKPRLKKDLVKSEDFLNAVQAGLQARFDYADQDPAPTGAEAYEKAVALEWDQVKDFVGKEFEDANLQKAADKYLKDLEASKDDVDKFATDLANSSIKYTADNGAKIADVVDLYKNYGLKLDQKYNQDIKEYIDDSEQQGEDEQAAIDFYEALQISKQTDDYGNSTYKISGTNTTDRTLNNMFVSLSLEKMDGTVVGSATSAEITGLEPGQKFEVDLYPSVDDVDLTECFLEPDFTSFAESYLAAQ